MRGSGGRLEKLNAARKHVVFSRSGQCYAVAGYVREDQHCTHPPNNAIVSSVVEDSQARKKKKRISIDQP